jgi:membrane protein DedA with SNARE-associated domain
LERTPTQQSVAESIQRYTPYIVFAFALLFVVVPRVSPWDGLNDNLRFMERFSEWVLRTLERLFTDYGYYVVFFGVLLENSMLLGLLVPGAIILILAGLAAENGSINLVAVLSLAVAATIIGDTISYAVGRLGWTNALERTGMGKMIEKVREPMQSHSTWLILAYHLAGYSRVVGPAAAGIFRIPFRRWAPLDYAGGAIWVGLYTGLGVVLGMAGVEFGDTKSMVRLMEWFFLAIFAAAVVIAVIRSTRKPGEPRPATVIVPVEDDR